MTLPPIFPVALLSAVMGFLAIVRAAPGDVDAGFNPGAGARVKATAIQPDGKMLVGGGFTTIAGGNRNRLARFNANDTLDGGFNPNVNGDVYGITALADGKVLISGEFTSVGGVTRRYLAKLNSDGSPDPAFNSNVDGIFPAVYGALVQPDGKIVIAGVFTTINGVTRNNVARLNGDGSLDADFDPNVDGWVYSLARQGDGKILIVGNFNKVGGVTRTDLARLNADGSLDSSFNGNVNGETGLRSILIQADNKIVIGGFFSSVRGATRNNIARLNPDSTLDTSFNPNVSTYVYTMAAQADGKLLIGGEFTVVGTVTRTFIARLSPDGAVDPGFNPNVGGSVDSIAIRTDGKIVIGGSFADINGAFRNRIARLENDAATQTFTAQGSTRIEWLRGGAAPEINEVSFDLSTDGGAGWSPLGEGTRISGGWELAGFSLPASGQIRARGRTVSGTHNGSAGLLESTIIPSGLQPEISVEQPALTLVTDGGSRDFGTVLAEGEKSMVFSIRNVGNADLAGLGITFAGANASDFTVSSSPATSLPSGGATSFAIKFVPTTGGIKSAILRLASNDEDENPFDINLTGRALVASADEDGDGIANGTEVALASLGFDPLADSSALRALVQANAPGLGISSGGINEEFLALGSPVLEKNPTTGKFHLTLRLEKSSNLSTWSPMSGFLPTYDIPNGEIDLEITPVGSSAQFYRVFGTKP